VPVYDSHFLRSGLRESHSTSSARRVSRASMARQCLARVWGLHAAQRLLDLALPCSGALRVDRTFLALGVPRSNSRTPPSRDGLHRNSGFGDRPDKLDESRTGGQVRSLTPAISLRFFFFFVANREASRRRHRAGSRPGWLSAVRAKTPTSHDGFTQGDGRKGASSSVAFVCASPPTSTGFPRPSR